MQDARELLLRPLLQAGLVQLEFLHKIVLVGRRLRITGQHVEFLQDTAFHLVRGLIGERNGQHVPVCIRFLTLQNEPDVFPCQVVCFAGTRRRFQNLDHTLTKVCIFRLWCNKKRRPFWTSFLVRS